ncbi:UNVERIFIED_CONTAM: hypothetical protein K2H54_012012 [Gekko kuhli]
MQLTPSSLSLVLSHCCREWGEGGDKEEEARSVAVFQVSSAPMLSTIKMMLLPPPPPQWAVQLTLSSLALVLRCCHQEQGEASGKEEEASSVAVFQAPLPPVTKTQGWCMLPMAHVWLQGWQLGDVLFLQLGPAAPLQLLRDAWF